MGFQPHNMNDMEKEFNRKREERRRRFLTISIITILIFIFSFIVGWIADMNFFARKFGGDITINLQENEKLVNITWKNSSMWILTRPMRSNEEAETYSFKEDSNFGIFQGNVTLIESKTSN